jgi:hypothetical protein
VQVCSKLAPNLHLLIHFFENKHEKIMKNHEKHEKITKIKQNINKKKNVEH